MAVGDRLNPLLNENATPYVVTDESLQNGRRGAGVEVMLTTGPDGDGNQIQGNIANDAVDSGNPVKIGGYASSSVPSSVSSADRVNAWFLLNGSLAMYMAYALNSTDDAVRADPATSSLISSSAYEASHVIKASAGKLMSLNGYNSKGSAQFIQVYNAASLPADTAVPIMTFTVPASSNFSIDWPGTGLPCSTGIVIGNSSTGNTKTIGSADCFFTAVYI